jgi:hypothetical protein
MSSTSDGETSPELGYLNLGVSELLTFDEHNPRSKRAAVVLLRNTYIPSMLRGVNHSSRVFTGGICVGGVLKSKIVLRTLKSGSGISRVEIKLLLRYEML